MTSPMGHLASDTTYLTAVDRDGNIVSLIQSNFQTFGSGIAVKGMGFVLQDRGALFSLDPNSPNVLAPRKRPFHTIIPAFMEREISISGFGIMGGANQPAGSRAVRSERCRLWTEHPAGTGECTLHRSSRPGLQHHYRITSEA